MGMLDMVTALEWVHNNIAYFGGNPDEITIFGESAGSATIGHMLLSSETNGLFARGIGSSGSPLATWAFDTEPEMHARYYIVYHQYKCETFLVIKHILATSNKHLLSNVQNGCFFL